MADKQATVYIVDISRSMGEQHQERELSDLDWSLQWVWDKITAVVQTGRKTLHVGVVEMGSHFTNNMMAQDDPSYRHINILHGLSQLMLPELQKISKSLEPSEVESCDVLSAIIVGVDMIIKHCKQLKYTKKVVVVTNGSKPMDADDVEEVAEQMKKNNIELVILGVDFDDPEYGFKEEDKSPQKAQTERALHRLAELSGGMYGTMQEAIEGLSRPEIKVTKPTPTYKGCLSLGDPEHYDTALTIDVERYIKVQVRRPPTATAFAVRPETESDGLTQIAQQFSYTVKDETAVDGVKTLQREDLSKGYEYGRTAVHISETDENITKLETFSSYDILGFIPMENVERYMIIDTASMLVAQKGNDKAAFALSSLIHALYELGSVAVARFVKKDMAEPAITVLSPLVEADFECLIENTLPFAEDVRTYRFPPVDKVLTVSGKTLTEHRNLPNQDLLQSMSDFVDDMSLMEGDEETFEIDDTFSPTLHTVESAIKYRALYPSEPLAPRPALFSSYAQQPADLQEAAQPALQRLIRAADVKKVPPKVKGRKRYREAEKPLSGLDIDALFKREKRPATIDRANAIPEFKQLIAETTDQGEIRALVKQMGAIVEDLTTKSFGEQNFPRTLEMLSVVREEILELEMPAIFNAYMRDLRLKVKNEQLGGDRREWWWKLRLAKLGLIEKHEISGDAQAVRADAATEEEVAKFWSMKD
jgi:ATP-dependent DNA helicase 2 subunit 2